MTPQKTKLQIIEELFDNYYVKDPSKRATYNIACSYYQDSTGNKCAVGMCMLDDATAKHYESVCSSDVGGLNGFLMDEERLHLDDILKEEYRGHAIDFWAKVQVLHDGTGFWTEDGLSEGGLVRLDGLKTRFA